MKKVYSILITICLFCVFTFGTLTVFAAQIDSDTVSDDGTRIVNISPNGEEDDTLSIRKVLKDSMCNKLVVNFEPGEYTLTNSLPIFDNTTLNANGAVFNQKTDGKGLLINGFHMNSSYGKGSGGYGSLKNVVINGGTWVGTAEPNTEKTLKDNGFYVGYSSFLFMHAQNITIKNCSFKNNYNGHFIELAGVRNARIENCNMAMSGSRYVGEGSNEAIQIDNTYQQSNSPSGAPWDDTACENITISNCKIKFARGIGTNRVGNTFFKNIKVQGCTITSTNEALNMYDVLGLNVSKCTIKTTGKFKDYRSVAMYVGLDSVPKGGNASKANATITNNKIYGNTAGLKMWNLKSKAKFNKVTIKGNKIYCKKGKDKALQHTKSIKKLVKSKNTIKKW